MVHREVTHALACRIVDWIGPGVAGAGVRFLDDKQPRTWSDCRIVFGRPVCSVFGPLEQVTSCFDDVGAAIVENAVKLGLPEGTWGLR